MDADTRPELVPPTSLFSPDIVRAIGILHDRYDRATRRESGDAVRSATLDRLDRALDELIAHSDRKGDPAKLANCAWGNAGKVVRRRAAVVSTNATLADYADPGLDSAVEQLLFEMQDAIGRSPVGDCDRLIVSILIDGGDAGNVAEVLHTPVTQSRVWVSRARSRVRAVWLAA